MVDKVENNLTTKEKKEWLLLPHQQVVVDKHNSLVLCEVKLSPFDCHGDSRQAMFKNLKPDEPT